MSQVGDLDSILSRIGTWKIGGYVAGQNAATVASAIALGYVTEGASGKYELTDAGIAKMRGV